MSKEKGSTGIEPTLGGKILMNKSNLHKRLSEMGNDINTKDEIELNVNQYFEYIRKLNLRWK